MGHLEVRAGKEDRRGKTQELQAGAYWKSGDLIGWVTWGIRTVCIMWLWRVYTNALGGQREGRVVLMLTRIPILIEYWAWSRLAGCLQQQQTENNAGGSASFFARSGCGPCGANRRGRRAVPRERAVVHRVPGGVPGVVPGNGYHKWDWV